MGNANVKSALKRGSRKTLDSVLADNPNALADALKSSQDSGASLVRNACRHGFFDILEKLRDLDAAFEVDKNQRSPVHWCVLGMSGLPTPEQMQCLQMALETSRETPAANEPDDTGCTALHYAAERGLQEAIVRLLFHAASPFVRNNSGQTPADLAASSGFEDIALHLECQCLMHGDLTLSAIALTQHVKHSTTDIEETVTPLLDGLALTVQLMYTGCSLEKVREVKDKEIIHVSECLYVPLATAERLLRVFEWNKQVLIFEFAENSEQVFRKAGVHQTVTNVSVGSRSILQGNIPHTRVGSCSICFTEEDLVVPACGHGCCRDCWLGYLRVRVMEGDVYVIPCPCLDGERCTQCTSTLSQHFVESLLTEDLLTRYLTFELRSFVLHNPRICWCPYPECTRAIQLEGIRILSDSLTEHVVVNDNILSSDLVKESLSSYTVDCGLGHYFCLLCREEAHAPCGCQAWKAFKTKLAESLSQEKDSHANADALWLANFTKPCPNSSCKARIEKIDGCNHMKCRKCGHNFCWECLGPWDDHSSDTGGYYNCTMDKAKADEAAGDYMQQTVAAEEASRLAERCVRYKALREQFDRDVKASLTLAARAQELATQAALLGANSVPEEALTQVYASLLDAIRDANISGILLLGMFAVCAIIEDEGENSLLHGEDILDILMLNHTALKEAHADLKDELFRPRLSISLPELTDKLVCLRRARRDLLSTLRNGILPLVPDLFRYDCDQITAITHVNSLSPLRSRQPSPTPPAHESSMSPLSEVPPVSHSAPQAHSSRVGNTIVHYDSSGTAVRNPGYLPATTQTQMSSSSSLENTDSRTLPLNNVIGPSFTLGQGSRRVPEKHVSSNARAMQSVSASDSVALSEAETFHDAHEDDRGDSTTSQSVSELLRLLVLAANEELDVDVARIKALPEEGAAGPGEGWSVVDMEQFVSTRRNVPSAPNLTPSSKPPNGSEMTSSESGSSDPQRMLATAIASALASTPRSGVLADAVSAILSNASETTSSLVEQLRAVLPAAGFEGRVGPTGTGGVAGTSDGSGSGGSGGSDGGGGSSNSTDTGGSSNSADTSGSSSSGGSGSAGRTIDGRSLIGNGDRGPVPMPDPVEVQLPGEGQGGREYQGTSEASSSETDGGSTHDSCDLHDQYMSSDAKWTCSACTFRNHPLLHYCEMCTTDR
eukprot:Rmarinus@m.10793